MWRFLKKLEIELPYNPAIPLLGIHTKETRVERDTCIPMFITALFIIASTWKQPRCPTAEEWIRKLWYMYTMEYYSAIWKECIWISTNEMDETGAYYAECSKSSKWRKKNSNTVYSCIYMEFRMMVTMTLYARQQKRHRCKAQSLGLCGRRWGWDDLRE